MWSDNHESYRSLGSVFLGSCFATVIILPYFAQGIYYIMTESRAHISIGETPVRPLSSSPLSPPRKSPMPPCSSSTSAPPAEIESRLTRLSTQPGVLGCLVLSRRDGLVIRSGGAMFDPSGPGANQRAEMLKSVTKLVRSSVDDLARDIKAIDQSDELGFLRIRTKKYEIMVTPNDKYLLVVLQDPNIAPQ